MLPTILCVFEYDALATRRLASRPDERDVFHIHVTGERGSVRREDIWLCVERMPIEPIAGLSASPADRQCDRSVGQEARCDRLALEHLIRSDTVSCTDDAS